VKGTPRTDKEADFVYDPHHKKGPDVEVVDAAFARRLERELVTTNHLRDLAEGEMFYLHATLEKMTKRAVAAEKVCKAADGWDTVIDEFGDTTNHNLACQDIHEALKAWREAEGKGNK